MFGFFKKRKKDDAKDLPLQSEADAAPEPADDATLATAEPAVVDDTPAATPETDSSAEPETSSSGEPELHSPVLAEEPRAAVDVDNDTWVAEPQQEKPRSQSSWSERLKQGLAKTRAQWGGRISGLFSRGGKIDEDLYEELETILLTADVGVEATQFLLDELKKRVRRDRLSDAADLRDALKAVLLDLLRPLEVAVSIPRDRPYVIMLAGVNGAGKTTSIGKLAKYFQQQDLKVLLAAGDTFRAAAREQLQVWGQRNNVSVIAQSGNDAAAVAFDAVAAARARGVNVAMVDTAGRLPTQLHLMEEIKKIQRVIGKAQEGAPDQVWLVIDANTGQNAVAQVKAFDDALGLTGLIVTKLDGSAKGGVLAAIARQRPVPVCFIGVGEGLDDLRPFVAQDFVDALFDDKTNGQVG